MAHPKYALAECLQFLVIAKVHCSIFKQKNRRPFQLCDYFEQLLKKVFFTLLTMSLYGIDRWLQTVA